VSLKPPWRQKNPVMEKACPAYYKNTAPAEAVKIFKDMKVVDRTRGKEVKGEIIYNGGTEKAKSTVVLYTLGEYPAILVEIVTGEKEVLPRIEATKLNYDSFDVYYKGKKVFNLARGDSSTYKLHEI